MGCVFSKSKETEAKLNKRDLTELKSFCAAKGTINKIKRKHNEWEKIFANDTTAYRLILTIYKQLKYPTSKKKLQNGTRSEETFFQKRHTDC